MYSNLRMEKNIIAVGEMPSHRHTINSYTGAGGTTLALLDHYDAKTDGFKEVNCGFSGSNQYHNNVSPCVASYAWKRIA